MIRKFSIRILLLLLPLAILSGCSKNDIEVNPADILGTWMVYDIRSDRPFDWDGDGFYETDIFGNYSFCQQDILLVFEEGGYGQSRQGCNAPWQNMYWQLQGGRLLISLPGDDLDLYLIQLNSGTIRGQDNVFINGENFTITYTLVRR